MLFQSPECHNVLKWVKDNIKFLSVFKTQSYTDVLALNCIEKVEMAALRGYSPRRVPTSNMKRAPSRLYRASVAGSRPSDWDGVWARSFLSQYQHGFVWSRFVAKLPKVALEFSLPSFIWKELKADAKLDSPPLKLS